MKKILLGTSAVALAGASATSVNAAEWDVAWGGNMATILNFVSTDQGEPGDFDGFDVLQNGEIHFKPSITLDNGLTFGVQVELEADSFDSADRIDEAYVTVGGSFGTLEFGSTNSPLGAMGYGAPGVGYAGVRSGTLTGTLLTGGAGDGFGAGGDTAQLAGDAMRVNYYTPRFAGFQIGVGYARAADEDDRAFNDRDAGLHDIFSIGANYDQSFGNVRVQVSGTFETGSQEGDAAVAAAPGVVLGPLGQRVYVVNDTAAQLARDPRLTELLPSVAGAAAGVDSDPKRYALGAVVGFSGVSIGGSWAHADPDLGGNDETDHFTAGVSYATGPWGVSLSGAITDAPGYDTNQIALNGTYAVGPGVTAGAYVGWAEQDIDGGGDIDGFAVGTGFTLKF